MNWRGDEPQYPVELVYGPPSAASEHCASAAINICAYARTSTCRPVSQLQPCIPLCNFGRVEIRPGLHPIYPSSEVPVLKSALQTGTINFQTLAGISPPDL